jgi:DNA (cytosine-5)-methyltransferase 1
MRIGSACSGYGGLDAAVREVLGGELAWVADNDDGAAKILAHHFPLVPNLGDITVTDWRSVEPVDLLAGGYPCQPDSDAGPRRGAEDERFIWPSIASALGVLQPRRVFFENVPGHLRRSFPRVLADLAVLGYHVRWTTVRAADAGAPHLRARVFIYGDLEVSRPSGSIAAVLRDGAWWQPQETLFGGQIQLGKMPPDGEMADGYVWLREPEPDPRIIGPLLPTPAASNPNDGESLESWDARNSRLRELRVNGNGMGTPLAIAILRLLKTPTAQLAVNGGSQHPDKRRAGGHGPTLADQVEHLPHHGGAIDWQEYEPAIRQWERLLRPAPAPTAPGRGGKPRLSPALAEWMMGLDEGHVTSVPGLTRPQMFRAIGNGVVRQQSAMALRMLLERADAAPLVAARGAA